MKIKHGKLVFEYNQITEYIYLGTNQCCQAHFNKTLIKKGIKADISLEGEKIDNPFGVKYFLWLPTKDHMAPSIKTLKLGVNFLDHLIENKTKVYIHCQRGHARAASLVIAYIAYKKGISVKESLEYVKKKRPTVHPNPKQIKTIENFLKKIKK